MTKENPPFRRCSCCDADLPIHTGRGRPHSLCKACSLNSKKENEAKRNKAKADRAIAVLNHVSRVYKKACGSDNQMQKIFMATLYKEIRNDPFVVSVDFRRALTRMDKSTNKSPTFATYFGAFCKEFRGLKVSNILKKNTTFEERQSYRDLESAIKAKNGGEFMYPPSDELSAISTLLDGYETENSIIDEDDIVDNLRSDDMAIEIVDNVEKAKPDAKSAILSIIKAGGVDDMTYPDHIKITLVKSGYEDCEIVEAFNELIASRTLYKDLYGQLHPSDGKQMIAA